MKMKKISSIEELHQLILDIGFLPFFQNSIPGFSIEECISKELWFSDTLDGPWEWKGPIAEMGDCVYGKIFQKKAGFVSLEWYPVLANYRRNGYDFDALYDDGMAAHKDKYIYEIIQQHGSLLSNEIKELCNYKKGGNKGFDTIITRLQMETYITIDTFEYKKDKSGHKYGWGVAKYTTPEEKYGKAQICTCYDESPLKSKQKIFDYLSRLFSDVDEKIINKMIG